MYFVPSDEQLKYAIASAYKDSPTTRVTTGVEWETVNGEETHEKEVTTWNVKKMRKFLRWVITLFLLGFPKR